MPDQEKTELEYELQDAARGVVGAAAREKRARAEMNAAIRESKTAKKKLKAARVALCGYLETQ